MTAAEWTTNPHALAMLDALLEGGSHAMPLRRFACACGRRMGDFLPRERLSGKVDFSPVGAA